MKALRLPVSENNFENRLLCSYILTCNSPGRGQFLPQAHHMKTIGRGPQGDAI